MDNEYGEQTEVELLTGGRDIQVTNENVIKYIHLVAHHRLNTHVYFIHFTSRCFNDFDLKNCYSSLIQLQFALVSFYFIMMINDVYFV